MHSFFHARTIPNFVFFWLFLAYCLLPTAYCIAQSYNFKNYSAEEGLPFVQVYAIYQDSKGNLWTGGYGGLSKFDGKTFTNYSPKNGLANHWVTSISEDRDGNIWVGTISGISKLEGDRFTTFTKQHGLVGDYVNALTTDRNGNLWIATTKGITIYDGKNFTSITEKNGLNAPNIYQIYADKAGIIWLSSDAGVTKIVFNQRAPQDRGFDNYSIVSGIYNTPPSCFAEDDKGNIWFGSKNGAMRYDGVTNRLFTAEDGLYENDIQSLAWDKHSNAMWVGTLEGLNRISGDDKVDSFQVSQVQSANKVGETFMDAEENLWLGTQNGLYRFRDAAFTTYSEKDGLLSPFIFPIFRDHNKFLWAGTLEEGFYRFDGRTFRNFSMKDGLLGTQMYSGVEDKEGNIWMGSNQGVSVYNGNSFRNYKGKTEGLKSDSVTALLQDSKGRIWLGGNKGGSVWNGKKFKHFDLPSGNTNYDVWYLFEDSKGNIWMGTYLGGLFRYDGEHYEDYTKKLSLKSTSYLSITEDKHGNMYFGSFDGVYIYQPASGKVSLISEANGLSSDLVYVMSLDTAHEYLFIGTNQGVNRLSVKEYLNTGKVNIKLYGQEEGLSSLETNSNGIWRDADGTFWFGTVNGLIHFDPYKLRINQRESVTGITGIRLFYNDTLLVSGSVLPYDHNNISFSYIGVCLTNPGKVRYKVMLSGYDNTWSPETNETSARYSNLAPGNYVFKVMSCNNEGLWNSEPVAFSFTIEPPVWRTWWFRLTLATVAIILIIVFSKMRADSIRRKEAERLSREIRQAGNELKALRAQMDPHFIFNSLSSIQSFIMSKDEDSALRYLNKFAKLMRTILANSEKPSVTIREEVDSLRLYMELEALRWDNKFSFAINIDSSIETDFLKIPSMLIQPFVENAILHGVVPKTDGAGKIEVSITQRDMAPEGRTYIICTISDNGIGRKQSQQRRQTQEHPAHESMGIKITSERLEVLNRLQHSDLSIKISDPEDANGRSLGTVVELFIPAG